MVPGERGGAGRRREAGEAAGRRREGGGARTTSGAAMGLRAPAARGRERTSGRGVWRAERMTGGA